MDVIDEVINELEQEINKDIQASEDIEQLLNSINAPSDNKKEIEENMNLIKQKTEPIEQIELMQTMLATNRNHEIIEFFFSSEQIKNEIEKCLICIGFPMFNNGSVSSVISKNEKEIEFIHKYFTLLSLVVPQVISQNIELKQIEVSGLLIAKKIISSLIPKTSFDLVDVIDSIYSYLTKSLLNTAEFITLLFNDGNKSHIDVMKFIIKNIFTCLNASFLSKEEFNISINCNYISAVKISQKIIEFNNEILLRNFKYDSLTDETLSKWFLLCFTEEELSAFVSMVVSNEAKFCESKVQYDIDNVMKTELSKSSYNSEAPIENAKTLIKDIMSQFIMFKSPKVLSLVMKPTCEKILITFTTAIKTNPSLISYLYYANVLLSYRNFYNQIFPSFETRISQHIPEILESLSMFIIEHSQKIETVLDSLSRDTTSTLNINDIVLLFAVNNILNGNAGDTITKIFKGRDKAIRALNSAYSTVGIRKEIKSYFLENVIGELAKKLKGEIDIVIKKGKKPKDVEMLVDKTKEFVNKLVGYDEINWQIKKMINNIYEALGCLELNKN